MNTAEDHFFLHLGSSVQAVTYVKEAPLCTQKTRSIFLIKATNALCYTAETNTPLQSNYTPIKMLKKKATNAMCVTGVLVDVGLKDNVRHF